MKRTTRKLSESTKQKIANSLKGIKKTERHKQAIAKGMEKYWKTIPETAEDSSEEE